MRIMLTNDDGIRAPGILALHEAINGLGDELRVIAPRTVQSATSHGVTFHKPLQVHEVEVNQSMSGLAVDGRPADCVKLAITTLWEDLYGGTPDLVISGMNAGVNVGIHIIYSGTVGAAIEAAFLGVPAIAVSLHFHDFASIRWDLAGRFAREAIDRVLATDLLKPHSVININIPVTEGDLPADEPAPDLRVVPMNLAAVRDRYLSRGFPAGQRYYWINGDGLEFHDTAEGSDVEAIMDRFITVTPLQYDLTAHREMETWRKRLGGV
ncbi:MAG: 5'/3'-nucleotidase SurE [Phycisphaerales bacterium]